MTTSTFSATDLHKSFASLRGGRTEVLNGISLHVDPGEFVSIIGPSGCGKSTLFEILAGVASADSGDVKYGAGAVPANTTAYMPQRDLLFPWLMAQDNAALGLRLQGVSKRTARHRVHDLLWRFRLEGQAHSYPFELSGGMRQRVALLRTMVLDRPVLLLDEPFGALDYLTRTDLQLWLADVCAEAGVATILITHDVPEALLLSDRIYALSNRPATVQLTLSQETDRPRGLDYLETEQFRRNEKTLLSHLTSPNNRTNTEQPEKSPRS